MSLQFQPKPQAATERYFYDFAQNLAAGVTISSAEVEAAVYSGTDPSPSAIVYDVASISGSRVGQRFTAGVDGVIYQTTCTVITSDSQILLQTALLAVVES